MNIVNFFLNSIKTIQKKCLIYQFFPMKMNHHFLVFYQNDHKQMFFHILVNLDLTFLLFLLDSNQNFGKFFLIQIYFFPSHCQIGPHKLIEVQKLQLHKLIGLNIFQKYWKQQHFLQYIMQHKLQIYLPWLDPFQKKLHLHEVPLHHKYQQ